MSFSLVQFDKNPTCLGPNREIADPKLPGDEIIYLAIRFMYQLFIHDRVLSDDVALVNNRVDSFFHHSLKILV